MRHWLFVAAVAACDSHSTIRPDREHASEQGEKSGTRLKARFLVASDGSEQPNGFFDSSRRENCTFATAADGVTRCLPAIGGRFGLLSHYFADSACTHEVFPIERGSTAAYATAPSHVANTCTTGTRLYPLGQKYTGQLWEQTPLSAPQCTRSGGFSSHWDYYFGGPEVPPTAFQSATEVVR